METLSPLAWADEADIKTGFEDGDPRRSPYTAAEMQEALAGASNPRRWHPRGADWLAVQLQYGCGMPLARIRRMFNVGETVLRDRFNRGKWSRSLPDEHRRDISRRVWLTGLCRGVADGKALQALKDASNWPIYQPEPPQPLWQADGNFDSTTQEDSNENDRQRELMAERLRDLIARLDAGDAQFRAQGAGERNAGADAGAEDRSPEGGDALGAVGQPGADTA